MTARPVRVPASPGSLLLSRSEQDDEELALGVMALRSMLAFGLSDASPEPE